jgi:hypothetical protein
LKEAFEYLGTHFMIAVDIVMLMSIFAFSAGVLRLSSFEKTCNETFQRCGGVTVQALNKVNKGNLLFNAKAEYVDNGNERTVQTPYKDGSTTKYKIETYTRNAKNSPWKLKKTRTSTTSAIPQHSYGDDINYLIELKQTGTVISCFTYSNVRNADGL